MQWCSVFNLVIARPVRKPVVAIPLSNAGITDSHASDIGHWLGMTWNDGEALRAMADVVIHS